LRRYNLDPVTAIRYGFDRAEESGSGTPAQILPATSSTRILNPRLLG
jgi:hypothetical protein